MTYEQVKAACIAEAERLMTAEGTIIKDRKYRLGKVAGMVKALSVLKLFTEEQREEIFEECLDIVD